MIQSFKTMKKDIEEDSRSWNGFPCSWIYKLNRVKMAILPKQSVDLIKYPSKFRHNSSQIILNFIWKNKMLWVVKIILINKRISRGLITLDFKLYYRAILITLHGISIKADTLINRIEDLTRIHLHRDI